MTFRFGVVAGTARTGAEWITTAQRAEQLGYDTLLVPDTVHTLAPFAALAAAAAGTDRLRLGTYVLSVANRSPGLVAWESQSLHLLSGGRFELGLGGGRPGAEHDAAALGADFGSPGRRLQRVAETIRAVRAQPDSPAVLVAASRPRMLRLAAEQADIVALGLAPQSSEEELAGMVAQLRGFGGSPEVHLNVTAVAETAGAVPEWVGRMVGGDARAMAAAGGVAFLLGDPPGMAETLRRRRDDLGITYIGVNAMFMDAFAPVITELRGR